MTIEAKYLIMVEANTNHNKFYKMIPNNDGTFTVEYGRVGANGIKRKYPISQWDAKYREKMQKNYKDISDLRTISVTKSNGFKEIDVKSIKELIDSLQEYANAVIKSNYSIEMENVTQKMIDEAQILIDQLGNAHYTWYVNDILNRLFITLPRKMKNVDSYLIKDMSELADTINREQDLLDVMASQVGVKTILNGKEASKISEKTILEHMGIKMEEATEKEIQQIKKYLTSESEGLFHKAWSVHIKEQDEKFDKYVKENHIKNIKFYYHGTRNENVFKILQKGKLLLRPAAIITGKMFGYGLYFAPRAKKSINYTSLSGSYWAKGNSPKGYLLVFKVAEGKTYDVYSHSANLSTFTEQNIKALKCNSLFAHKGQMLVNDEVIVYNEDACTLRYIVELK